MKRGKLFIKILVVGAICLLMIPSLQGAFVDIQSSKLNNSNEGNDSEPRDTISYQNCIVYIFGKCKTVVGPLTWIFGFYCPLFKKHFWIQASGQEGESLNVIVTRDGFGAYYDYENIRIELQGATGVMYWFGKSWIFTGDQIFARCVADYCWITI
jgi:hypothetical protein